MSKEREKVKCKTKLEFITEVADDCVANLKDKDREHLIRNPYAIDYHFSYCLYIRNHYIHNRDKHMCYYDSVESVRQSRALSERNRPGLFS